MPDPPGVSASSPPPLSRISLALVVVCIPRPMRDISPTARKSDPSFAPLAADTACTFVPFDDPDPDEDLSFGSTTLSEDDIVKADCGS